MKRLDWDDLRFPRFAHLDVRYRRRGLLLGAPWECIFPTAGHPCKIVRRRTEAGVNHPKYEADWRTRSTRMPNVLRLLDAGWRELYQAADQNAELIEDRRSKLEHTLQIGLRPRRTWVRRLTRRAFCAQIEFRDHPETRSGARAVNRMTVSSVADRKALAIAFGLKAEDEAYFAELDERVAITYWWHPPNVVAL